MMDKLKIIKTSDLKRILPGVLISTVALVVIFIMVDLQEVIFALSQAEYKYLLIGIPVYLAGYVFRALAWKTLLRGEVEFKEVFLTMQAGYLLNNILPLRLGELGRALILGRKNMGFWRVFSTILIERAFDMILAAGLLLGTIPYVLGSAQSMEVAYIVGSAVLIGLLCLHLLARYQGWVMDRFLNLSNRWTIVSRFGADRLQNFFQGLSSLTSLQKFLRVLVWMILSWSSSILYHYFVLLAFVPKVKILWAAFGLGTVSLGVALPSSPSYIGIIEAAWVGALSLFGLSYSSALAYALTVHLVHILISLVFGSYALGREGESLGQIYRELLERRRS